MQTPNTPEALLTEKIMKRFKTRLPTVSAGLYNAIYNSVFEVLTENAHAAAAPLNLDKAPDRKPQPPCPECGAKVVSKSGDYVCSRDPLHDLRPKEKETETCHQCLEPLRSGKCINAHCDKSI